MLRFFAIATAIAVAIVSLPALTVDAQSATSPTTVPQTPLLSARRFPGSLEPPAAGQEFRGAIDSYLNKVQGSECALVELDGRVLYSRDVDNSFVPASLMKLATSLAAMEILGADRRLQTEVASALPLSNGTVTGDLFVVGGGDPLLTTKGYITVFEDPNQFVEDMGAFADSIVRADVKRITGGIVGDDSRHESQRWIPSWPSRYQTGGTVAPLSALLVNDGSTGYTETPDSVNANRKAGDPPLLFAQTLLTMLRSRGVVIDGGASAGRAPNDREILTTFDSAKISELVGEMLANSDNTTAELLLREIGRESSGNGTTAAGITAAGQSLQRQGFNLSGFTMVDGSGLDPLNRMTCTLALALSQAVDSMTELSSQLPIAGRFGTLRKRMLASASTGNVRAKTGTLNGVNGLAGVATATQGSSLSFSFLHNGPDPRTTGVADGFTDRLIPYGKSIKLAAIEPLPPK